MKKVFKIVILVVLSLFVLIGAVSYYLRNSWRWFGFEKCTDPNTLSVSNIYVSDDEVHIEGTLLSSASRYGGYRYEIEDDALYIGLRYGLCYDGWAGYSVTIREDFSGLSAIYLSGDGEHRCIWTRAETINP